jgi:hypothetical protein
LNLAESNSLHQTLENPLPKNNLGTVGRKAMLASVDKMS